MALEHFVQDVKGRLNGTYLNENVSLAVRDYKLLESSVESPISYYIFNYRMLQFELVSKGIEQITGYNTDAYYESDAIMILQKVMHPQDVVTFAEYVSELLKKTGTLPMNKLKKLFSQYTYRIISKDSTRVKNILHRSYVLDVTGNGQVLREMGIMSDVSQINIQPPYVTAQLYDNELQKVLLQFPTNTISDVSLTKREKIILGLYLQGKNSNEIAAELHLSPHTVLKHRSNFMSKLDVKNTAQLILKTLELNLL